MPRGIDVEKSRPGVRRGFGLGVNRIGAGNATAAEAASGDGRRRARAGRSVSPADKPPTPGLRRIAAKADDLEAIKAAVDDAAEVGGGLWLSYLFVLFYPAAAAGAVTHRDLFFEHTVKLPFLTGVELPLVAFFALAPLIFVVVHAYTLVHLVMLQRQGQALPCGALREDAQQDAQQEGPFGRRAQTKSNEKRKRQRDKLRLQLPSNIFIEFLAGPSGLREGFRSLLRAIAWITLVSAPVPTLTTCRSSSCPIMAASSMDAAGRARG